MVPRQISRRESQRKARDAPRQQALSRFGGVKTPPENFKVDEEWYLATTSTWQKLFEAGRFKSAHDHFMQNGYAEGRKANQNGI